MDPGLFPEPKGSWEYAGGVTKEASEATGLKEGTPVAFGAGDVCSSALGSGCIEDKQVNVIIGTAGIYTYNTSKPKPNRRWGIDCHAVPGKYLLLAPSLTGGSALRWFKDELMVQIERDFIEKRKRVYECLDELAATSPPGSNGIMFWPFLSGERSPINKPNARGSFMGLALWSKRCDIVRAILEGVAYSAKDNLGLFEESGLTIKEARISGGGKRSKLWCSIISDVVGYPLIATESEEDGALGAAIEAGCAAGTFKNPIEGAKSMVKIASRFEPNPENHNQYSKLFSLYRSYYGKLWDWYEEFSDLNE